MQLKGPFSALVSTVQCSRTPFLDKIHLFKIPSNAPDLGLQSMKFEKFSFHQTPYNVLREANNVPKS